MIILCKPTFHIFPLPHLKRISSEILISLERFSRAKMNDEYFCKYVDWRQRNPLL